MSKLTQEDKNLIKALHVKYSYSGEDMIREYPEKEWCLGAVNLYLTRINSARLGILTRKYIKKVMHSSEFEKFNLYPPKVSRVSEETQNFHRQYDVDGCEETQEKDVSVDENFLLPVVEIKELEFDADIIANVAEQKDDFVFPCDSCELAFTCRINFLRHMKYKHHMLADISKVEEDENEHSRQGMIYICTVCRRTFRHSTSLRKHQITHSDTKPFKCDLCGFTFKRSESLKCHRRKHKA